LRAQLAREQMGGACPPIKSERRRQEVRPAVRGDEGGSF
jgi:hypothetical protein